MKIRRSFERASELVETGRKDDRKISNSRGSSFQTQYRKTQDENTREHIQNLLEDITKQSDILSKKVDLRELKLYKNLIAEFLQEAVNNSHIFFKSNVLDRRGRHRVWAVVKRVNDELEKLTREVLDEEKDNIRILKTMEDIRGLLLDIIM